MNHDREQHAQRFIARRITTVAFGRPRYPPTMSWRPSVETRQKSGSSPGCFPLDIFSFVSFHVRYSLLAAYRCLNPRPPLSVPLALFCTSLSATQRAEFPEISRPPQRTTQRLLAMCTNQCKPENFWTLRRERHVYPSNPSGVHVHDVKKRARLVCIKETCFVHFDPSTYTEGSRLCVPDMSAA